jgi:hypothetical protein
MSTPDQPLIPSVKPFGNTEDPRGFYQLLRAHVTWLSVHNFSKTTGEKRALSYYWEEFSADCATSSQTSGTGLVF